MRSIWKFMFVVLIVVCVTTPFSGCSGGAAPPDQGSEPASGDEPETK
jgi:hypothetical protein